MSEKPVKLEGVLLDVVERQDNTQSFVELYFKDTTSKKSFSVTDRSFHPFFYVIPRDSTRKGIESLKEKIRKTKVNTKQREATPFQVTEEEKEAGLEKSKVLKVEAFFSGDVHEIRNEVKRWEEVLDTAEFDIGLEQDYVNCRKLKPMGWHEVAALEGTEGLEVESIAEKKKETTGLTVAAFDIEILPDQGFQAEWSNPENGKVILISYASNKGVKKVFACNGKLSDWDHSVVVRDEKEMIEAFASQVREDEVDVLLSYNGDEFDFKYLKKRAEKTRAVFALGRDGSPPRIRTGGQSVVAKVTGRPHVDVYKMMTFLDRIGVMNLPRYTLKKVHEHVFGEKLKEIQFSKFREYWQHKPHEVAEYCLSDSVGTLRLGLEFIDLNYELCRLAGVSLETESRITTGSIAEYYLVKRAREMNLLLPRRPKGDDVSERFAAPIEGAYVKEPVPGLHENIAEFDFGSFYPTIITSHNISPETLEHAGCKNYLESPKGHKFCQERKGFFPLLIEKIIEKRKKAKTEMKKHAKDSDEHAKWYAFQWGLKILQNSMYGYLAYPRGRWYSRPSAESITAWAREYIKKAMQEAETAGLRVIYGDTDSLYAAYPSDWNEERLQKFSQEVDSKLPEKMELEFAGVYPRGVFVSTKEGEKGAKKRYALVSKEGTFKIRGFELVRGDWSNIAKDTQMKVLEFVLKEGKPQKAVDYVHGVVERLKKKSVPLEELVIHTQITRPIEAYAAKEPHVEAAKKANRQGDDFGSGSMIDYVITSRGDSISDKAVEVKHVREGDYDVDYYVNNQVAPAAHRILGALGIKREDLVQKGTQKTLGKWFG